MKPILAALLLAVAAAAHAQSYDERVAAERLAADLVAVDKAQMAAARARADAAQATAAPSRFEGSTTAWGPYVTLAILGGALALAIRAYLKTPDKGKAGAKRPDNA